MQRQQFILRVVEPLVAIGVAVHACTTTGTSDSADGPADVGALTTPPWIPLSPPGKSTPGLSGYHHAHPAMLTL